MNRSLLTLVIALLLTFSSFGQGSLKWTNPSYKYYSRPGFVNITEVNGGKGLGDTGVDDSRYYLGITNVFGYQINRHFVQGLGIGFLYYDNGALIPLYLDIRHYRYLKKLTTFIYADGGLLIDYNDINHGTKVFINPGIGITRSVSSAIEGTFSAGLMLQMGDNLPRTSFFNVKLGMIYRKNSYRMKKSNSNKYCAQ